MGKYGIPDLNIPELLDDVVCEIEKDRLSVLPGMKLLPSDHYCSGSGTYENNNFIFSSLVGFIKITEAKGEHYGKYCVEVIPLGGGAALVRPGEIVTAVVARVTARGARCELRCVGSRPLGRSLRAQLLRENVHDTNIDRVDIYKSFRPGDIILAKVLPVTSLQSYELTTAEPELGVVIARASDAPPGVNMHPLNWNEMQCPVTLVKEYRKVAKIVPENILSILREDTQKQNDLSEEKT